MTAQIEIQLIAVIVSAACAIPGVFLVLRKMSMMTDAITHTILLGIVIAFFMVKSLNSPLLILGAAAFGLLTVYIVEIIFSTGLVAEDSAIGIVFPLLFSAAIILISKYAGSVHLCTDTVLLGEIAFAPFNRMEWGSIDFGAKAIYSMGAVLIVNILLVVLFFKELKISTFDPGLAKALGLSPLIIYYGLMASVSVTAVGAFESVGSILVIAFMVGPPVTAYLVVEDLKKMILLSTGIGIFNALAGYRFSVFFDISIAGSMALITGITFFAVFIFSPGKGILVMIKRRKKQKEDFAARLLLFHVFNHEGSLDESNENGINTIYLHLNWKRDYVDRIINKLKNESYIEEKDGLFLLTPSGRKYTAASHKEMFSP